MPTPNPAASCVNPIARSVFLRSQVGEALARKCPYGPDDCEYKNTENPELGPHEHHDLAAALTGLVHDCVDFGQRVVGGHRERRPHQRLDHPVRNPDEQRENEQQDEPPGARGSLSGSAVCVGIFSG